MFNKNLNKFSISIYLLIDRQIDRQIDIQIDRQIDSYLDRQIDRYIERQIDILKDIFIDILRDRQINLQRGNRQNLRCKVTLCSLHYPRLFRQGFHWNHATHTYNIFTPKKIYTQLDLLSTCLTRLAPFFYSRCIFSMLLR